MGQKSPEVETYYMGIQVFKIINQMDDLKFDDNFPVTGMTKIKKKEKTVWQEILQIASECRTNLPSHTHTNQLKISWILIQISQQIS